MMSVYVLERHASSITHAPAALHSSISGVTAKSVAAVVAHGNPVRYLHVINSLIHFPRCFPDKSPDHFGLGVELS